MPLLAMSVVLFTTGCPQSQNEATANTNAAGAQNADPAAANLASGSNNPGDPQYASATPSSYQQSPPPPDQGNASYQSSDQSSGQSSSDPGYGEQPVTYASQPPPPLPNYDQPPDPGDGYLWTPGYWGWASAGYYWVPGAWVEAPYEGALWTPGYWGFWHNRYGFYRGYWGRHIGYYGGINYGFGYGGLGYEGGYWGGGHFNYNRSVNNINTSVVHHMYDHPVGGDNRGSARVSFNGGSGGIQVRARPAELNAIHEQHAAPMAAQVQNERSASTNRAQFANVNHGHPASVAVNRPLAADRNVRVPAAAPVRNQGAQQLQQRQGNPQQRQVNPQQQQRQTTQQEQQRQVNPQQQQRQAPQPQRQQAPPQQQRKAAPQPQRQQAPQKEEHPKK